MSETLVIVIHILTATWIFSYVFADVWYSWQDISLIPAVDIPIAATAVASWFVAMVQGLGGLSESVRAISRAPLTSMAVILGLIGIYVGLIRIFSAVRYWIGRDA